MSSTHDPKQFVNEGERSEELETPVDDVEMKPPKRVSPLSPNSTAIVERSKQNSVPSTKTIRVSSASLPPGHDEAVSSEPDLQLEANGTYHSEARDEEFEDIDEKVPVSKKPVAHKRSRSRVGHVVRKAGTGVQYAGRAALKTAVATGRVAVKVGGHAVRGAGFVSRKAVTGCLSPRMRLVRTFFIFICCFFTTGAQLAFIDFYYITYTCNTTWYAWIAGDALVLGLLALLLFIQCRYSIRCMREREIEVVTKTEYAWIFWLAYATLICSKVVTANYTFSQALPLVYKQQLTIGACPVSQSTQNTFGLNAYRTIIATSTIVFLMLILSHHYSHIHTPRQVYLSFLASTITLDILDSVQFMDFLYPAIVSFETAPLPLAMQIVVQVFACVNFILPTFALLKLRFEALPHVRFLPYQKMYTVAYFLMSNVPYLVVRVSLFATGDADNNVQIFLAKNVIGVIISIREIWLAYLFHKEHINDEDEVGDSVLTQVDPNGDI